MKYGLPALLMILGGCASSGVIAIDRDTYMIAKRSPQVGFGPPVAATAYVYREAHSYCAAKGRTVETVTLDQVDSGMARPAAATLKFKCVPQPAT